jgi:glycosyltransferase involved in cell wall biosynthesis
MVSKVTIVLPAKNEAESLRSLLPELRQLYTDEEIIVVNDGSSDNTLEICQQNNVRIINHPYSMGNGAAIKSGARAATGEIIVFMDSDRQHNPNDISKLLDELYKGYDMVVGARSASGQANVGRFAANTFYNKLASWMVNQNVKDLTSGFRVVRTARFREFIHLLPNGFSYPTTSTMAFFRAGYRVGYLPIKVEKRIGKSHVNILKDGVRFLLIIFKIGTLYSPLKLFTPVSALHLFLGLAHYAHTYFTEDRFTNMSALLITTAVVIFLIGLVSEQITTLIYQTRDHSR